MPDKYTLYVQAAKRRNPSAGGRNAPGEAGGDARREIRMSFEKRLEKKLGRYAVPNLMRYICAIYALGFLIQLFNPDLYFQYLDLNPKAIVQGQLWRLITFLFYYPSRSPIWALIGIFVYYSLGQTLEQVWGTFRYNLFFWTGALLLLIAALLCYFISGISLRLYPAFMGFSIFLAYALSFPDSVFLLYFIIPVKAKYMALIELVLYLYFLVSSRYFGEKVEIVLSILNVLLFYFMINERGRKGGSGRKIIDLRDFR